VAETQTLAELLDGGLVTGQDISTLKPGQLALANNAVYLPNDPAIYKVKGRTKYNSVAITGAGNVVGLRYCEFDTGNNFLLALTANDIQTSVFSDETGTFALPASLTDAGAGATLDAVHNNNRYVLLLGTDGNKLFNYNNTARQHGMNPVPRLPSGAESSAPSIVAGNFNAALGTGFFHFLTTEVLDDGVNPPIESTFLGPPATASTALTTPSSQAYSITRPPLVNAAATKWRIYMAGPTDNPFPAPIYADFRLVIEQNIENTTAIVGNTGIAAARFPTTNTTIVAGWVTPNNAHAEDNVGTRTITDGATQDYQTFGITGITGTVTGIEVFVSLRIPTYNILKASPVVFLQISGDNGATFYPTTAAYIEATQIPGAITSFVVASAGSLKSLWDKSAWSSTELNDTNFRVRVRYGLGRNAGASPADLYIDYVQVKVFQFISGSTSPSVNLAGTPFRTVNVNVAGITTSYGADGPPPVSSTGDMFEGQLVLNDVTDQSIIRYSLPDNIESFPSIYFLNFESKVQDVVTYIRRLGNKLLVGLRQQLYRVNYLPRESDAEFDRGRSYESISETEGIVGTQAACLFSPEGGPLYLAYISHAGPRYTDGFQTFPLNNDLDWATTVRLPVAAGATNYLQSSILVDYPLLQQLWFYYTPPGQTTNTKAMVFHYSRDHRNEDGTCKATGPIDVAAYAAVNARLAGNDVLLTGQSGGFVYVEDRGFTHAAGGTIPFAVKTREIYPGAPGSTASIESLFVRHGAHTSPSSSVSVTPYTRYKDDAQATQAAKSFTTANAGLARLYFHHNFESIQFGFTEPGADAGNGVQLSQIVMDVAGTGLPER